MIRETIRFLNAILKFNLAGCPYAPARLLLYRLSICDKCEHIGRFEGGINLLTAAGVSEMDYCKKCDCTLHEKAEMLTEGCPVKLWHPVNVISKDTDNGRVTSPTGNG